MNKEAYDLIVESSDMIKTRWKAVCFLLGCYGEIDVEIFDAIQTAYINGVIGE